MAELAFFQGDLETSFLFFEQTLDVNPTGAFVRGLYAARLLQSGRTVVARDEMQRAIDLSRRVRPFQNAYLYLSRLDDEDRAASRQIAYLISAETDGIAGLVAILANEEIGEMQRAQDGILSLGPDSEAARHAISEMLRLEGFLPDVSYMLVARFAALESWKIAFGASE